MDTIATTNLDLGRDLQFADFEGNNSFPIDARDSGNVYCYDCTRNNRITDDTPPLTSSSGVFTSLVLCENDAPVYICLKHIDRSEFTPEVQQLLLERERR